MSFLQRGWKAAGIVLLAAAVTIAGCGKSGGSGEASPSGSSGASSTPSASASQSQTPAKEKVVIEVWTNSRHDKDVREAMVKKFNETNDKNIQIDYKIFTDNYNDQLKLALNSGQLPDLIYNFPSSLSDAKIAMDLTPYITPEMKARFSPAAFNPPPWVGGIEAVLENATTFKLVYNKDLFRASGLDPEKPPATWDEMRQYAKTITEKGGGKKFGLGLPLKQTVFWNYYVIVPAALSGDNLGRNGFDATKGEYDFSKYAKYIQWWIDVNKDGSIFPGIGTYDNDMIRAQFSEGNVGMLSAATWDIGVFNDQFPAKIDWGVADFPTWDGKAGGGVPYETGNGWNINKDTKHPEEAKAVWEFFLSDEMFVELAKKGLGSYTNLAAQDKSIQPTDRKGVTGFLINDKSKDYPFSPKLDYSLVNPPPKVGNIDVGAGAAIFDAMNQAFLTGKDIDKQMKELGDAYNQILKANVDAGKVDMNKYVVKDFNPLN
ncbi:extracellular solute-binding protein [Cohnella sp. CFH 77786]|uniref:ABC transporter substrate-binding protein n=1 Tax=Cohnella sp. CFH 77786 TaxID=2662265 RepID=UPI001C60ED07|nr:ABC transporter substrate-binding protein [Cohnella sp. CFH 77786]MBW5448552.1 extracellular solute-binding protein [Cohnella sp. CFH 77786]